MLVIVFTAMVLSVELILVTCALFSHVPIPVDLSFVHSIVWHYQRNYQPQRNLFFYGLWVVLGTGAYTCLLWLIKFSKAKIKWDLKMLSKHPQALELYTKMPVNPWNWNTSIIANRLTLSYTIDHINDVKLQPLTRHGSKSLIDNLDELILNECSKCNLVYMMNRFNNMDNSTKEIKYKKMKCSNNNNASITSANISVLSLLSNVYIISCLIPFI